MSIARNEVILLCILNFIIHETGIITITIKHKRELNNLSGGVRRSIT